MAVDVVHDTQNVFRSLLDSMARPGKVVSLAETASRIDHELPCYSATFLLALTTLDSEVSFHVLAGAAQQDIELTLTRYTHAKKVPITEADFIIVPEDSSEEHLTEAMSQAKKGTLIDPQLSATFIIECPIFSLKSQHELTGPGIQHTMQLPLDLSQIFIATRQACNVEYPLGIDLIFTEPSGDITCIPRTTVIREVQ